MRLRQRRQHAEAQGEDFRAGYWMSARGGYVLRPLSLGRRPRDSWCLRLSHTHAMQHGVVDAAPFRVSRGGGRQTVPPPRVVSGPTRGNH